MPGEMITEESRPVLEFLQMLCEIGAHYPGFETDIHGAYRQADGRYTVKVLKEESKIISSYKGSGLPLPFLLIRRTHENTLTAARDILYRGDPNLGVLQFYGMRALLILYLTHQLGLMITMPSACSAHMLLWFTLPLFSAAGLPTACSATALQ